LKLSSQLTDLERLKKEKLEVENQLSSSQAAIAAVEKEKETLTKEKLSTKQVNLFSILQYSVTCKVDFVNRSVRATNARNHSDFRHT